MEENKIANVCRNGAYGDVVYCSAVTTQLKTLGYQVIFYTKCQPVAKLLDGVDVVVDTMQWGKRPEGRDVSMLVYPIKDGYPAKPMTKHLVEYACEEAGLPVGETKLKSFPRPKINEPYVTFQPLCGWSSYKEWDHWEPVIEMLSKHIRVVTIDASRPWAESFALIQHARFHLGQDSVGNHVAGAYKTPAVILFGSTSPTGSGYPTAINLWKPWCDHAPCYYEDKFSNGIKGVCMDKCINHITLDEITAAITELFDRTQDRVITL